MRAAPILILSLAAVPALFGQAPPISAGDPVRITAPDLGVKDRIAVFEAMRGDTLFLRGVGADSSPWQVPLSSIKKLEVNHGNKPPVRHTWQGAAIGGGFAFFIVVAMKEFPANPCAGYCATLTGPNGWAEVAKVTLIGGLLGAGIGYAIKSEPFTKVPLPPKIVLLPTDRGVMLAAGWRF